jgi:hypothetical protein
MNFPRHVDELRYGLIFLGKKCPNGFGAARCSRSRMRQYARISIYLSCTDTT